MEATAQGETVVYVKKRAKDILHNIQIKLYKSNLPDAKGQWFARTANNRILKIEDVVDSLKTRGGGTGNYDDIIIHVRQYFEEAAYLLADGYAINTGFYKVYPVIGGSFKSRTAAFDPKKHRIEFHFLPLRPLRRLAAFIRVSVADRSGQGTMRLVETFVDMDSGTTNKLLTPGGVFTITGRIIKIAGDGAECGVWFISASDPKKRYMAAKRYPLNGINTVIGHVPNLPAGKYTIEVKTQHTRGGKLLKEPRTITGLITLTVS